MLSLQHFDMQLLALSCSSISLKQPTLAFLFLSSAHLWLSDADITTRKSPCHLQSVDPNAKLSDPRHHSVQRLSEFLSALSSQAADPRAPAKELVKPQKLLKRLLPWLQKCKQVIEGRDSNDVDNV
jgi:hypothetical protein